MPKGGESSENIMTIMGGGAILDFDVKDRKLPHLLKWLLKHGRLLGHIGKVKTKT